MTHTNHQEIERTARLTPAQFQQLQTAIQKRAQFIDRRERFMICLFPDHGKTDFSSGIDLRLKWTDGAKELVFKRGLFGSAEREELTIRLAPESSFAAALEIFYQLGYPTAVAVYRFIERYQTDRLEVSFINAGEIQYVEVEYIGPPIGATEAIEEIDQLLGSYHLEPLSVENYHAFIRELDQLVNLTCPTNQAAEQFRSDPVWQNRWKKVETLH